MPTHLVHWPEVPSVFAPYPVAVKGAGLIFLSGLRGARQGAAPAAFDEIPAVQSTIINITDNRMRLMLGR